MYIYLFNIPIIFGCNQHLSQTASKAFMKVGFPVGLLHETELV